MDCTGNCIRCKGIWIRGISERRNIRQIIGSYIALYKGLLHEQAQYSQVVLSIKERQPHPSYPGVLLQEILQNREGCIGLKMMPAIGRIQILTANRAKTFTIRFTYRTYGKFQQCILSKQRLQVNLTVFRNQQTGFCHVTPVESIYLRDRPFQNLGKHLKATHALEIRFR
jgi:hypothetical protein